jgi:hypothetical protein
MNKTVKHLGPLMIAVGIAGALVFAPVGNADAAVPHNPHAAPSSPPDASQYGSGEDPMVPTGTWAPGDIVPYDPFIKNSGGGVDLPS